jgi:hypothetical protein
VLAWNVFDHQMNSIITIIIRLEIFTYQNQKEKKTHIKKEGVLIVLKKVRLLLLTKL